MIKVVIDTNSLIDADSDEYNFSNRIIDKVIAGEIEAYANSATLQENKFIAPKKLKDQNFLIKLEYFWSAVKPVESLKGLNVVVEDPEDNKILESAISARADYLITSDKHLLKLEKFEGVKIVRPGEFWSQYNEETGEGWMKWIKDFIN